MVVTAHYDAPDAWAAGADPAYEALSWAVVSASPVRFEGRTIADLGAGTGATSRAIAAAGGRPVAVDVSLPMLGHNRAARPPAAAADIAALPFCDGGVGGVVAAFSLSHVDDPAGVLREAARVTANDGPVLAGVFATTGVRHEVVSIVESLAVERGWTPPAWYLHVKDDLESVVADTATLERLAKSARLTGVNVTIREVDANLDTAETLVQWRLSGPALATFVSRLTGADLASLRDEARRRLGDHVEPLRPAVCILSSVAAATR